MDRLPGNRNSYAQISIESFQIRQEHSETVPSFTLNDDVPRSGRERGYVVCMLVEAFEFDLRCVKSDLTLDRLP